MPKMSEFENLSSVKGFSHIKRAIDSLSDEKVVISPMITLDTERFLKSDAYLRLFAAHRIPGMSLLERDDWETNSPGHIVMQEVKGQTAQEISKEKKAKFWRELMQEAVRAVDDFYRIEASHDDVTRSNVIVQETGVPDEPFHFVFIDPEAMREVEIVSEKTYVRFLYYLISELFNTGPGTTLKWMDFPWGKNLDIKVTLIPGFLQQHGLELDVTPFSPYLNMTIREFALSAIAPPLPKIIAEKLFELMRETYQKDFSDNADYLDAREKILKMTDL